MRSPELCMGLDLGVFIIHTCLVTCIAYVVLQFLDLMLACLQNSANTSRQTSHGIELTPCGSFPQNIVPSPFSS